MNVPPLGTFSGGVNVTIFGPGYVTVGVPSTIMCDAGCPGCLYSMSLDGQTAQGQGNVLSFTINEWVEAVMVSCTATEEDTQQTATATKKLQVLGKRLLLILSVVWDPSGYRCPDDFDLSSFLRRTRQHFHHRRWFDESKLEPHLQLPRPLSAILFLHLEVRSWPVDWWSRKCDFYRSSGDA